MDTTDVSDLDAPASAPDNRRKSGRVVKKPEVFAPPTSSQATKRKRDYGAEDEDVDMEDDASDEDDEDEDDSEPSEEERREQRRNKRKSGSQRKPAAKKPKANGAGEVNLAIRPAVRAAKAKRSRRPRPRESAIAVGKGLYGDVFSGRKTIEEAITSWLAAFRDGESAAVADLFTFTLKCAGCDHNVDATLVEDPDHFTEKLTDIQDEYQSVRRPQNVTEYPLIARGKGAVSFKQTMVEFYEILVRSIAATTMFDDPALMENIMSWLASMTSASNRPFRHTATVASLAIVSALCDVGSELVATKAQTVRQLDGEKKKGRPNKSRVADIEKKVADQTLHLETLDEIIKGWFDTVFVHRYRDIDPRIRVDCVQALSYWISQYPDLFLEGHYLRYLGWVLSDTHAPTRLEVVRKLRDLFSKPDRLAGLRSFIERFRQRMVEMATQDADPVVRSASVELLDTLRENGSIEPDDIDVVGKLIYDSEARVRQAVVPFFAQNVMDIYELKVEDVGGVESLQEILEDSEHAENPEAPTLEWLKIKSLVELLEAYDSDETEPTNHERVPGSDRYLLIASGVESRFSMAATLLCEKSRDLAEFLDWEYLAAYLLFDHSAPIVNGVATNDIAVRFKDAVRLSDAEELIVLEILNASVKLSLTETAQTLADKKVKRTKAQKQGLIDEQEEASKNLAKLIPRLLNKFGAQPSTASAVLRLERALNLDIFQALREESTMLPALLDDINKQFLTHGNESVLAEASMALLHAKSYEDLEEITAGKLQSLWDDTMSALHFSAQAGNLMTRGSLKSNALLALSNTVLRIANLSSISDCTDPLEASPTTSHRTKSKSKSRSSTQPSPHSDSISLLTTLLHRGVPGTGIPPEINTEEDALVLNATKALLFHLLWKVKHLAALLSTTPPTSIPDAHLDTLAAHRDAFVKALATVIRSRPGADEVRCACVGAVYDLACAFSTLRQFKGRFAQPNGASSSATSPHEDFLALVLNVDPALQDLSIQVLGAAERTYARRSGRALETGDDEEEEPETVDEEPESEEEIDEDEDAETSEERRRERLQRTLVAEQRLCELASKLVLAVAAGLVGKRVAERLGRNKGRLGANFREVVGFFEKRAAGGKKKGATGKAQPQKKGGKGMKSAERVMEVEDDEIEEEEEGVEKMVVDEIEEEDREEDEDVNAGAEEEPESVLGD
ncbi:hypothetical protein P152DRAFT_390087 [Eremomyces bilateralis CBS 781.70]|uniref:SCD domain-containing protein n=1 Tax=Eremomyces bilateralis CBS 781.70 TaxID=1392243 RepID=A0A6G1GCA0_9PEZI|nr:uncharacterized protein P152DRAFT_390087 [Eremomyces bilateralis CBS 781.70]KAF1815728.1 hypothetical protein P152DRAFT_390087 [Eremomyces bilateralis CBS 781.70]